MNFIYKIAPLVENTSLLHLLIEVDNHDLYFLIYSQSPFQLHGYYQANMPDGYSHKADMAALEAFVQSDPYLGGKLASVKICYNSNASTLIPASFFKVDDKAAVLNLLCGVDFPTYAFHEAIPNSDIILAYRVPCTLYNCMQILYPKNTFMHSSSLQLSNNLPEGNVLQCMVYGKYIKIFLHSQGELLLATYFYYNLPQEVSYYLLNVCQQYKVDVADVKLMLSGLVEVSSNLYDDVYKYFLQIAILPTPSYVLMAPTMQAVQPCFYNTLTTLALCE